METPAETTPAPSATAKELRAALQGCMINRQISVGTI